VTEADHIVVDAFTRAGRPATVLDRLVAQVPLVVATAAGEPQRSVWFYLRELDPTGMVEYGRVLAAPGGEEEWIERVFGSQRSAAGPRGDGR
jgi:hypothetical protein